MLALHVPIAFAGEALAGLWGLALALAITTAVALSWMLVLLDALPATVGELAVAAGTVAALVVAAFGLAALVLDGVAAAAAGTALFVLAVAVAAATRAAGVVDLPPGARVSARVAVVVLTWDDREHDAALPPLA